MPGGLPQSPAMAEHGAAALAGQVAYRPINLALDCKAVICSTQQPLWRQMATNSRFAGVRRFAHELPGTEHLSTFHVKAHRELGVIEALECDDRRFALANRAVDAHAKQALSARPRPEPQFLQEVELYTERALAFLKLSSALLPLFKCDVRWRRTPFFSLARDRQRRSLHMWRQSELGLQCRTVLDRF